VKIRCRNRSTRRSQARQSTASQSNSSPSGPFTAPTSADAMPNLPFGSSFVVIVSHTSSPDPRQPASAAGHQARYPASYPRTAGRRASKGSRFPAAFRPPAFASRVILFPPEELGLPHGRLTAHHKAGGPRRGFHVPHSRVTTGVGALYTPGTGGALLTECRARPAPAASQRLRPCTPPITSHRAEFRFTRHQQGFTQFTRPVCPSPALLAMGRGLLRLSLGLRTSPLPATHAKEGARQRARARDYTTDITSALLTASPLAKCDLVSQRQIRMLPSRRGSRRV
jgi:hypothetical protein